MPPRNDPHLKPIRENNAAGALTRSGVAFRGDLQKRRGWKSIVFYADGRVTAGLDGHEFRVNRCDVEHVMHFDVRPVKNRAGGQFTVGFGAVLAVVARLTDGASWEAVQTDAGEDHAEFVSAQLNFALEEMREAMALRKQRSDALRKRIEELTGSQADAVQLAKAKAELEALEAKIEIPKKPIVPLSSGAKLLRAVAVVAAVVAVGVGLFVWTVQTGVAARDAAIREGISDAEIKLLYGTDRLPYDQPERQHAAYMDFYREGYKQFLDCAKGVTATDHTERKAAINICRIDAELFGKIAVQKKRAEQGR